MQRKYDRSLGHAPLATAMIGFGLLLTNQGCDDGDADASAIEADSGVAGATQSAEALAEQLAAEFPLYAAVTGVEVRVYRKPDKRAPVSGWLRVGGRVRLAAERAQGQGCRGGFHRLHPRGFVCAAEGLAVGAQPPKIETPTDDGWKVDQEAQAEARGALVLPPPPQDAPLPYAYYKVKEPLVPSFHRLPSRNEQRAALAKVEHYTSLLADDEVKARAYLRGEVDGPTGTAVVARYLDRGFFVASNGSEVRAFRRFVRSSQGRFVKRAQLEPMGGSDFEGVALGETAALPVAWVTRPSTPLRARQGEDGAMRFEADKELAAWQRLAHLEGYAGQRRVHGRVMHRVQTPAGPRYLKSWLAATAWPLPRPREVPAGSTWVHIDRRQQTAVLYTGDRPRYATLVSTGIEGNETPTGVFRIRRKRVTDTMAALGPDVGDDRYRVEEVPWTQYFEGSFALHAAFWHSAFGRPRSHGCVNMAPKDARRFFAATDPAVPSGWHGVSAEGTRLKSSFVVVTDEDLSVTTNGLSDAPLADGRESAAPKPQAAPDPAPESTATQAPAAETTSARDGEPGKAPVRGIGAHPRSLEPWRTRQPDEVRYAVKTGGTARFVANLYKLPHHVLKRLNPDLDIDRELPPGTDFAIYRYDPDIPSRSVGAPDQGKIVAAAPLPEGAGRIIKAKRAKTWATRRTIGLLDAVMRAWAKLEPKGDPLLVGSLSSRTGGKLQPHSSHQSGRDVDLGYPQTREDGGTYNWRNMHAGNLDARRTWRLLHLLKATGELERVFMDRSLQAVLYAWAKDRAALSDGDLSAWLEYPGAPSSKAWVQHVPGHVDHLHVRFRCGGQKGCQ